MNAPIGPVDVFWAILATFGSVAVTLALLPLVGYLPFLCSLIPFPIVLLRRLYPRLLEKIGQHRLAACVVSSLLVAATFASSFWILAHRLIPLR